MALCSARRTPLLLQRRSDPAPGAPLLCLQACQKKRVLMHWVINYETGLRKQEATSTLHCSSRLPRRTAAGGGAALVLRCAAGTLALAAIWLTTTRSQ